MFAALLFGVLTATAAAAEMEVTITVKGRGTVTGPGDFSCTNDNPDPTQAISCEKIYDAPDPFGIPEATFTASTSVGGWRFSSWSAQHFTSCNSISGADCTIRGRQNAKVDRPATVDFTRDAAPSPAIRNAATTDRAASFELQLGERVKAVHCVLEHPPGGSVARSGCPVGADAGDSAWRSVAWGDLPGGAYRFRFQVTDYFDHVAEASTDVLVVQTAITGYPPPFDSNTSPRFDFSTAGGAAFNCSIDGVLGWQNCGSPFTTPTLKPDGKYTMRVHAFNGQFVDPEPATYSWVVDTTAPTASIAEPAEGARLGTSTATVVFGGADALSTPLRFECRVDSSTAALAPCASPLVIPRLVAGPHFLELRAIDQAGNPSPIVRRQWVVEHADSDGDSFRADVDCNDADAKINPGATDVPGNSIDEDCADGPAPYPRIGASISARWSLQPFRFVGLEVKQAPSGATIRLLCRGRGCPFRKRTIAVRKAVARVPVLGSLRDARLRRGASVTIRVTLPGHVGVLRRYVVRGAGKAPGSEDACLSPEGGKPRPC